MSTEESKGLVELEVFRKFVLASALPLSGARKGDVRLKEPDVVCQWSDQLVGFELAEVCTPDFLAGMAEASRAGESVSTLWGGEDSSRATLRKKLAKHYVLAGPVHLLLYVGFTGVPDEAVIDKLQQNELRNGPGPFKSIWYFGRGGAYQLA